MIDQHTIERIQDAAQIYEIASDFITLRKAGVNYKGLCPFHDDRTPSLVVSPAKNIWKCFACGEGGTPIHFVMKHEQLTYVDALKYIARKYNIEVKETELTDEQKQAQSEREALFILNSFAQKHFSDTLFDTVEGRSIGLSYLRERGIREDVIRKFQLGYSLEARDHFAQTALKAGYKPAYLEKTGLVVAAENQGVLDRYRGRVIFPIHTLSGKIVGFGGRILKKADRLAKYINSPESEIYHKGNELYGLHFARTPIVKQDLCFLVEGYTDVIAMHQAGIENVVASSGTALTAGQIRLIRRFTNNITILYDGDNAGIKAALRGIDLLLEAGLNIKIVLLPQGEDPDSFSRKQSATEFQRYIETASTDFVRFKAGLLLQEAQNDPRKKAAIITEITETIALIPEEIIRLVYVKDCAKLLDIDERLLVQAIAKSRQEQLLKKKRPLSDLPAGPASTASPAESESSQPTLSDLPPVSPLDKYERHLLHYIIRYGEQTITDKSENVAISVIEFIAADLRYDDLQLSNPLYQKVLLQGLEQIGVPNFVAEHFFRNHSDPDVSRLAVDLSTDRYTESKRYSKHLPAADPDKTRELLNNMLLEQVPYVMANYKDALLKQQMDALTHQIQQAQADNDFEKQKRLAQELAQLWKNPKKAIAVQLRERIITGI